MKEQVIIERRERHNITNHVAYQQRHGGITVGFDTEDREPAYYVPMHYALNYVVKGQGVYIEQDGTRHPFQAGDFFQRLPGKCHHVVVDETVPFAQYYISMDRHAFDSLVDLGIVVLDELVMRPSLSQRLIDAFELTIRFFDNHPQTFLSESLVRAIDLLNELFSFRLHDPKRILIYKDISRACQYIQEDESKRMDLHEVARLVRMKYHSFRIYFKKMLGVSPGEYQIKLRINEACHLLADTSVSDVADLLGYNDVQSFSNQFKQHAGVRPRQFCQQVLHGRAFNGQEKENAL